MCEHNPRACFELIDIRNEERYPLNTWHKHRPKLTLLLSTQFPVPRDAALRDAALRKGWPGPIVFITRAIQHFTVVSALVLVAALTLLLLDVLDRTAVGFVALVAHAVQTAVGVLYHGMIWLNPFHLIPRENFAHAKDPEAAVRALTGLLPPKKKAMLPLWIVLHIQHTLAPIHMWLDVHLHDALEWSAGLAHLSVEEELAIIAVVVLGYGLWNFFCWYVRGEPAYPVQRMVYDKGPMWTIAFYGGCLTVMLLAGYAARSFRTSRILMDFQLIPPDDSVEMKSAL